MDPGTSAVPHRVAPVPPDKPTVSQIWTGMYCTHAFENLIRGRDLSPVEIAVKASAKMRLISSEVHGAIMMEARQPMVNSTDRHTDTGSNANLKVKIPHPSHWCQEGSTVKRGRFPQADHPLIGPSFSPIPVNQSSRLLYEPLSTAVTGVHIGHNYFACTANWVTVAISLWLYRMSVSYVPSVTCDPDYESRGCRAGDP